MKLFNTESLDDLEKGIKQLLQENRCSFSESEVMLLNDCIVLIQVFKSSSKEKVRPNWETLFKIVAIFLKIFLENDHLKTLF